MHGRGGGRYPREKRSRDLHPPRYLVVAVRAVAYILSHTGRLASHRKECMAFLCSLLSLLELPVQHAVLLPRMEE